jgi:L-tyrosine peroxygenase
MVTLDSPAVVTVLPQGSEWEYGGHAYGLEPLALPPRQLRRSAAVDRRGIATCYQSLTALTPADGGHLRPDGAEEIDRLFWFRWITGHQTTFLLWQLLAAVLDDVGKPGAESEELAEQACSLVRGYTLMLLYASSPTREIYERVIRSPMARQHVNLSGSWARDYAPVRSLIHGKTGLGDGAQAYALRRECEINEEVHNGIAEKVVPSGVSLLRSPKPAGGPWKMRRDTLLWLYDGIFLTSRARLTYKDVVAQLVRRLHAVVLDIHANGLHPPCASSLHEEPPGLRTVELMDRKKNFTTALLDILRAAGGPAPHPPDSCVNS